jgi:hypothetical protein
MRIAVISCAAYSDAWHPFFELLKLFWPNHPPTTLITDEVLGLQESGGADSVFIEQGKGQSSWGPRLGVFASQCANDPIVLFQEDFLLNAPVLTHLVDYGLAQMIKKNAGCCRLYPCPGADFDYGDPYFGLVKPYTPYRISCQVAIWRPDYLEDIARGSLGPSDFEIFGTQYASTRLTDPVLAWKRETEPWPMRYLCSAIGRGLWSQDAKRLCEKYGIEVDWSRRGIQAA